MDQSTNTAIGQNVDLIFTNLENFTQNEGVIGKPVTHENKTFLPVVSVTLGYAGGNSATKSQPDDNSANQTVGNIAAKMAGGALGLGAKLITEAVIIIDKDKDNVSLVSLTASGTSQLAEKIPQMLMNMGQNKQNGQQNQQSGTQNQSNQSSGMGNQ